MSTVLNLTYTSARANLSSLMNQVTNDSIPAVITRTKGENCVLLSEQDYNSLIETAYLMKSPANAKRLIESIEQLNKGKVKSRELINE